MQIIHTHAQYKNNSVEIPRCKTFVVLFYWHFRWTRKEWYLYENECYLCDLDSGFDGAVKYGLIRSANVLYCAQCSLLCFFLCCDCWLLLLRLSSASGFGCHTPHRHIVTQCLRSSYFRQFKTINIRIHSNTHTWSEMHACMRVCALHTRDIKYYYLWMWWIPHFIPILKCSNS